jgi:hypothetical protein
MRLIYLCSAVLIFTACKKNSDDNHSSSEFPNEIGDNWTYQVADTNWNNNQPLDISNYTMKVSVIGAKSWQAAQGQMYGSIHGQGILTPVMSRQWQTLFASPIYTSLVFMFFQDSI